jgi:hypothetical protein
MDEKTVIIFRKFMQLLKLRGWIKFIDWCDHEEDELMQEFFIKNKVSLRESQNESTSYEALPIADVGGNEVALCQCSEDDTTGWIEVKHPAKRKRIFKKQGMK